MAEIEATHADLERYKIIMTENMNIYQANISDPEALRLFNEARRMYGEPKEEDKAVIQRYSVVKDEIEECIGACSGFVGRINEVIETLETVANNDDREAASAVRPLLMGHSMQKMLDNLNSDINTATLQVNAGSGQIADDAQLLAQASTEQAATVEELSAAIAEIADKTKENFNMASRSPTSPPPSCKARKRQQAHGGYDIRCKRN